MREINALRPTLPAELRSSKFARSTPGLVNIVQFALVSEDAPYRELEDHARDLKDVLKAVDGIRTSESLGVSGNASCASRSICRAWPS